MVVAIATVILVELITHYHWYVTLPISLTFLLALSTSYTLDKLVREVHVRSTQIEILTEVAKLQSIRIEKTEMFIRELTTVLSESANILRETKKSEIH